MSIDIMLIGGFLGARLLGLHSMGMNLAQLPVEKISGVIKPVLFSVFSRSQVSKAEWHRQYGQTLAGLALIIFPAGLGLAAVSGELVPTMLGSQQLVMMAIVSIVAVGTPLSLLSSVNPVVLNSVVRVGASLLLSAIGVVVPAAILIGLRSGIVGAAAAVVAPSLFLVSPSGMVETPRLQAKNARRNGRERP